MQAKARCGVQGKGWAGYYTVGSGPYLGRLSRVICARHGVYDRGELRWLRLRLISDSVTYFILWQGTTSSSTVAQTL